MANKTITPEEQLKAALQEAEALKKENNRLAKENKGVTALLEEANTTLRVVSGVKGKNIVVKVDGKHVQIKHAVRYKGDVLMPADLAKNPAALKHLLETNSTAVSQA